MRIAIFVAVFAVCACTPTSGNEFSAAPDEPLKSAKDEVKILSSPMVMPAEPGGDIGDGVVRPLLQPMRYEEFSGPIGAGMGCSFVATGNTDPLFVATAEDSAEISGRAAIKLGGRIIVLKHDGFGIAQLEKGGFFKADNIELRVNRSGGQPSSNSEATYFWPAKLSITKYNGGTNEYNGNYACGA